MFAQRRSGGPAWIDVVRAELGLGSGVADGFEGQSERQ